MEAIKPSRINPYTVEYKALLLLRNLQVSKNKYVASEDVVVLNYYFLARVEGNVKLTRVLVPDTHIYHIFICVETGKVFTTEILYMHLFDGYLNFSKVEKIPFPETLTQKNLNLLNAKTTNGKEFIEIQSKETGVPRGKICLFPRSIHVQAATG